METVSLQATKFVVPSCVRRWVSNTTWMVFSDCDNNEAMTCLCGLRSSKNTSCSGFWKEGASEKGGKSLHVQNLSMMCGVPPPLLGGCEAT